MTGGTALAASAAAASALQAALRAEHAAVYGYGVVGAHLTGAALAAATSDWIAHQVARDSLEAMLRAAGRQPAAAAVAYRLPHPVHTPAAAMSLAVVLENRVTTAYLGLVALPGSRFREPGARAAPPPRSGPPSGAGRPWPFPGIRPARSRRRNSSRGRTEPG
jgi:hypothetical protein